MVKLSSPGKMPCKSWSLQAVETCPGARVTGATLPDLVRAGYNVNIGDLVPACQGCYATDGNYRFPKVKAIRIHNMQDWKRVDWEDDMVAAIGKDPYFRWLDSGDIYSSRLARKIYQVIKRTPGTKHWLPTRQFKFIKFQPVLKSIQALPNAVVRRSSDSIHGHTVRGISSTIFDPRGRAPAGAYVCPAYTRGGKCGDCRACWDKTVRVVAYPQHGRKMAAVNSQIIASTN